MSRKIFLRNFIFGLMACLVVVGTSLPSFSRETVAGRETASSISQPYSLTQSNSPATNSIQQVETPNQPATRYLQEAETALIARTNSVAQGITRYVIAMSGNNVVPNPASTYAFGAAGAVLSGNRFVVRGDFSYLSSGLRDYATDPVSPPNPNITSAVHIHKGEASKNGPFQYALTVENSSESAGRFSGEYMLTDEQLQALSNGMLYMDIHTKENRGGELRGSFKAY